MEQPKKVAELTPWELNPRKITPSKARILLKTIREYGDLGGIVYNRQLKRLVGGHRRQETLSPGATIHLTQEYSEPTPTGTVAEGYVEDHGERFSYRVVDWDETRHAAASLAANEAGGDYDFPLLKDLLSNLENMGVDVELAGFEVPSVENLLGAVAPITTGTVNSEEASSQVTINDEQLKNYSDSVRKAILIDFDVDHYQEAYEIINWFRAQKAEVGLLILGFLRQEKIKMES